MPVNRSMRTFPVPILIALIALLVTASLTGFATRSWAETATVHPSEGPTPMSQAIADDVAFSLISVSTHPGESVEIEIHIENQGDLPVRIETHQVALSVTDANSQTINRDLHASSPALPCGIAPLERLEITLTFHLEPGDGPESVSVGITEINRSGARVIFPLAPGAGASAIGGSGHSGVSAPATPDATANATPGASPEAGSCRK